MTDPLYIKWVQRTLNRVNNAGLNVDGSANDDYRNELARFKIEKKIKEPGLTDKQIGGKCQSEMIRMNHFDLNYATWIRKVLPNAPPPENAYDVLPDAAIRSFQGKENLKVDGWVGYKTELRLIQISGVEPPVNDGGGAPPVDAWVVWWNKLSKEESYVYMSERIADDYAKAACDFRLKCVAQKLKGLTPQGVPRTSFYFTKTLVQYLQTGGPWDYDSKNRPAGKAAAYEQLRKHLIKGSYPFGRAKYNVNNPVVQEILRVNYMESASARLYPYFAHQISTKAQYNDNYAKFFEEIKQIHLAVDLGIGEVDKLRDRSHGDPAMAVAQNLIKGLSQSNTHIYSCYKDQMHGGAWEIEGPF